MSDEKQNPNNSQMKWQRVRAEQMNVLLGQLAALPGVAIVADGQDFNVRCLFDSELDALKRSDLALERDINNLTNELAELTAKLDALTLQQQATVLNRILSPE
eukprot:TRINITY_DN25012_c0_g1_i1.p1 TRINITY_DN25012_c0_g1~~TRINITY_DN25012_c0_g1_i1.p1  ORF type:complete len:103 (-),score=27.82 TRINITY_DN25012_c0_g1_i1:91-399(-)